jgi:hypothetical protein
MIDMKVERINTLSKLLIILFNNISHTYLQQITTLYIEQKHQKKNLEFVINRKIEN